MPGRESSEFRGRVAVITGGNRGIGARIASAFAEAGASVAIAARDQSSLEQTATALSSAGARCAAFSCDVADERSVDDMGDRVLAEFGHVDVVVANAGIAGPTALLQNVAYDEWRECLAIDLDGVFLTFKRFIPAMLERRSGSMIAISSMTGKRPLYGRSAYAAAKMGVIGLVRTLALELGPNGIRVNAVCPGAVGGERIERVIANQARIQGVGKDVVREQLIGSAPLKRATNVDDVAATCLFLASDAAGSITGEDVNVSAGVIMY